MPKEELVGLLVKTNGRCKQLETRYAELKQLHEQVIEEKRKLVATRGRAGQSMELERSHIEATLRQSYEDRLQELEENASSSMLIKQQLQAELERTAAKAREEGAQRQHAEARLAEQVGGARSLQAELQAARAAADVAARDAAAARAAAAAEQAQLQERVMQLQGEVAASKSGLGGLGEIAAGMSQQVAQQAQQAQAQRERDGAAEAARKAEREEALRAQQKLMARLSESETSVAAARGELVQLRREKDDAAAAAAAERERLEGELSGKEKALSRALSNYKEEVGKWGERIQALERAKADAAAEGARALERRDADWEGKLAAAHAAAEERLGALRVEMEAEVAVSRSSAAAASGDAHEKLRAAERQAKAMVAEAEEARDTAVDAARESERAARAAAGEKLAEMEAAAVKLRRAEAHLTKERDALSAKVVALEGEMLALAERSEAQQSKWAQQSASASEHEAVVSRLRQQLDESEASYRQAKAVKATLEAEAAAWRRECDAARDEAASSKDALARARADADESIAAKEKEASAWKAKAKAHAASLAEAQEALEKAEKRVLAEAASHAAALAAQEGRVKDLEAQLESGRPAEAHMFAMAREQAKRDEEVGKLRAQLKSLREMLRESHRVLKHLMGQETVLKDELKEVKRKHQRDDRLNVEYLKNVTVAFLCKVYGDAEDEEHIQLARVLATLLAFTPEENALVGGKIEYYENSWWHRTANLLKPLPPEAASAGAPGAPGAAPEASAAAGGSWFGSWFGGDGSSAGAAAGNPRRQTIG